MIRLFAAIASAVALSGCFLTPGSSDGVNADGAVVGDDGLVLQTSPSTNVESGELAPPPPADD